MKRNHTAEVELSVIIQRINETRNLLNDLCSTCGEENRDTLLAVSKHLDKLIVKYMKLRSSMK